MKSVPERAGFNRPGYWRADAVGGITLTAGLDIQILDENGSLLRQLTHLTKDYSPDQVVYDVLRHRLLAPRVRSQSGASWNRTSDLSIISAAL
jgi:hypothetical protein